MARFLIHFTKKSSILHMRFNSFNESYLVIRKLAVIGKVSLNFIHILIAEMNHRLKLSMLLYGLNKVFKLFFNCADLYIWVKVWQKHLYNLLNIIMKNLIFIYKPIISHRYLLTSSHFLWENIVFCLWFLHSRYYGWMIWSKKVYYVSWSQINKFTIFSILAITNNYRQKLMILRYCIYCIYWKLIVDCSLF